MQPPSGALMGVDLVPVDLGRPIERSFDALVIAQPDPPIDAAAREHVAAFAAEGGSVAIFSRRAVVRVDSPIPTLERFVETGLEPWLESLGIRIAPALVADEQAARVPYRPDESLEPVPIPYPPVPIAAVEPIFPGVRNVPLFFASPIEIARGSRARPLLTSSPRAWRIESARVLEPRLLSEWGEPDERSEEVLAALIDNGASRLLIVGSSSVLDPTFFPTGGIDEHSDGMRRGQAMIEWVAGGEFRVAFDACTTRARLRATSRRNAYR